MKKHLLYMMRHILCGMVIMSSCCAVWADETDDASMSAQETQQIAAVREEVEKEVKESNGSLTVDQLFAIWDKTTNAISEGLSKGSSTVSKGVAIGAGLFSLIPKSDLNKFIQNDLGIKNVSIADGPKGFKQSFIITGTASAGGKPVFVTFLYAPHVPGKKKGGNSLTIGIPTGTPLDQIIPGANVSALGTVPISDMFLVLSDFEYTDPIKKYPIVSGLNAFVGLDLKGRSVLNLDSIKSIVHYEGAPIVGIATIARVSAEDENKPEKKKTKPTFRVIIPPGALKISEIKLSQLVSLLNVSLPASVEKELGGAYMRDIDIGFDLKPGYESFSINGKTTLFGDSDASVKYKIFRADASSEDQAPEGDDNVKKITVNSSELAIKMTPKSLVTTFPQLKTFSNQPLRDCSIRLVAQPYHDAELDADIGAGLDVEGTFDPGSLAILNTEKVKKIVQVEEGSVVGMMNMRPSTKEEMAEGAGGFKTTFKVIFLPGALKVSQVKASDLVDVLNIPMPANVKNEFSKIVLSNINVGLDITPGSENFSLDGDVRFFGDHALAVYKLFMADPIAKDKPEGAAPDKKVLVNKLSIKMDTGWNISSTFPQLKSLANISINNASLALVSNSYHDATDDMDIERGLQLDGFINLTTMSNNPVLKAVGTAIGGQIELHGTIPTDTPTAQFEVAIHKNRLSTVSVSLGDLVPPALSAMKKELSKASYTLDEFRMMFGGKGAKESVNIRGTAVIGSAKMPTEVQMIYVRNPGAKTEEEGMLTGSWKVNLILTVPSKAEQPIHGLDALSILPLSSFKMAMIEAPFIDPDTGIDFKKGFNIGGYLGFDGNLSFAKKLFPIKGLDGVNINGVVEKLDPDLLIRYIKLEAGIPGASTLKIGSVTMSSPKLYISLGVTTSFGIEGTMKIPVPKEFRPKGDVSETPAQTAYIPVTVSDIATSMDVESEVINPAEPEANEAPMSAESTVTDEDIFITEEAPPAEQGAVIEEQLSPEDLSPMPELVDVVEDLSDYGAPVGDNKSLTLTGSLAVSGEAGVMSCEMDGVVDILGLILKNVAFEGQVVIAAPPIPTGLGFRADMQIGTGPKAKMINFAAKMAVGATTTSYAWFGSLKGGLYLSDIVNLSYNVAKRAPQSTQKMRDEFFGAMKKIPKLGIEELEIAIIPLPTTIAGKLYEEGTLFDMKFVLFGARGLAKAKMGLTGMEMDGALDKIALPSKSPQFILSNFDGTKGPSLHFVLGEPSAGLSSLVRNQFMIDGNIEIKPLGMKKATLVMMTPAGGEFKMVEKMFGLYETELEGTLPGTHIDKTRLKGTFKQEGLTVLSKMLREASQDFVNDSKKELNRVRDELRKTYDDKIAAQRNIVRQEREQATAELSKANEKAQVDINNEINKTRNEISKLEKRIKDKENECKRAAWYRKADVCIKTGGEITGYGVQLGAQKTYLEALLKPGKTVAKGTIGAAKDIVNTTPIDSDPRVSSLIAAKEAALASLKIGNISAESLGEISNALATLGDQAINLKLVTLNVSVPDLLNLKLPKFSIEGIFFGKRLHIKEFEIDLKSKETHKLLMGKIFGLMKKLKLK